MVSSFPTVALDEITNKENLHCNDNTGEFNTITHTKKQIYSFNKGESTPLAAP